MKIARTLLFLRCAGGILDEGQMAQDAGKYDRASAGEASEERGRVPWEHSNELACMIGNTGRINTCGYELYELF